MTDSPRFKKSLKHPDHAYTEYYGARLVDFVFNLADAWRRAREAASQRKRSSPIFRSPIQSEG